MHKAPRVKRLRELIAEIELLPVSPDRDRLLSEFRSRAVDVDTGVTPRAILPLREYAPVTAGTPSRPAPGMTKKAAAPPAAAIASAARADPADRSEDLDERFAVDERLSLEDSLLRSMPSVQMRGARVVPPWTLGLRG